MVAVGLNTLLVIAQITYAYRAHSVSLLSDALHNLGDVLGLVIAWISQILLSRHTSERYSYGYKKSTILAALVNALLPLLTVGVLLYEAVMKLLYPESMHEMQVVLLASIGIVINGGTALLFLKGKEKDINLKASFQHLAWDALISLGVVAGALFVYFTGYQWVDAMIAFIVSGIIVVGSWKLLRQAVDLSLGAVPHGINHNAVRDYLLQISGVTEIHDLHIWGVSTRETALTAHLVMPQGFLVDADYQRINQALAQRFNIQHVTLQPEQGWQHYPCAQAKAC